MGNVVAENAQGAQRPVAKGEQIDSGDTISTNDGRAQLCFTDGGYVSLHERTVFRIDDYRWEGVEDRKAYLMSTAVATIGIRGTEYTMQLNDSLRGAVADGEIEVCNSAGCLPVAAGQAYFVKDADTKPVLSTNQVFLPPLPPDSALAPFGETSGVLLGTLEGTTDGLIGLTQDLTDPFSQTLDATIDSSGSLIDSTTGTLGGVTGTDDNGGTLDLLGR